MHVFITGASGFIGTVLTRELIGAGHEVTGLARSAGSAAAIEALGATAYRGDIGDIDGLVAGAARADGVVHLAFNHDFSLFAQSSIDDGRLIERLGAGLGAQPLLVTSGVLIGDVAPGEVITEDSPRQPSARMPRAASEEAAERASASGRDVRIVRLSQAHDPRRQGLVGLVIERAREQGVAGYVGQGSGRCTAVHVSDAARLYRLALERGKAGAIYHAVGEEGVPMRAIADAIGRRLGIPSASIDPADVEAKFGHAAFFVQSDAPASSERTRRALGWEPTGPGLIEDLAVLELDPA